MAENEFKVVISGDTLNCLINSLMALAVNQYRQGIKDNSVTQPNFGFIIQKILAPKFKEVNWDTFLSTCDIILKYIGHNIVGFCLYHFLPLVLMREII